MRIGPAEAEVAHQFGQLFQLAQVVGLIVFGELDNEESIGIATHGGLDDGFEHRDVAAEGDHGAVDEFDRDRLQLDEVLRRVHRLVEAAEVADAEHLVADQGPQLQFDFGREGERAFGADQKMRHVVRRVAGDQRIEVVAADPALHLWKPFGDFRGFASTERQHVAKQCCPRIAVAQRIAGIDRAEMQPGAVGECGIHGQCVVAHGAVAQRAPAAGIVAGHAADGGARGGGDIDRKPQAVFFQLPVEIVEHDAGLDPTGSSFHVERNDAVQVFGKIDHQPVIDGLAALRSAAAARGDDPPVIACNRQRPQRLVHAAGHNHARGHDLIERGVGRVATAAERIEQHVAGDLTEQARGEGAVFKGIWGFCGPRRRHWLNLA